MERKPDWAEGEVELHSSPNKASAFCTGNFEAERSLHCALYVLPTPHFFFFYHMACAILVPWPGIEPASPALEAQCLNHWTTREVPKSQFLLVFPLYFWPQDWLDLGSPLTYWIQATAVEVQNPNPRSSRSGIGCWYPDPVLPGRRHAPGQVFWLPSERDDSSRLSSGSSPATKTNLAFLKRDLVLSISVHITGSKL